MEFFICLKSFIISCDSYYIILTRRTEEAHRMVGEVYLMCIRSLEVVSQSHMIFGGLTALEA